MLILNVTKSKISIKQNDDLNKGEYNVTKCKFVFSKEYDGLVKKAVFFVDDESYGQIIVEDICDIPYEAVEYKGNIEIGVYAYEIDESGNSILRYSPAPIPKNVYNGSYVKNYNNSKPITPSEMDQFQQALNNGLNKVSEQLTVVEKVGQNIEKQGNYAQEQGDYAKEQGDYAKEQGDYAKDTADELKEKEARGEFTGAVFTPDVDSEGNLSWSNNKNLENPEVVNITGPRGLKGDCNFATFDIDLEEGNLIMNKPDSISQIDFALNENGNLEVITNV